MLFLFLFFLNIFTLTLFLHTYDFYLFGEREFTNCYVNGRRIYTTVFVLLTIVTFLAIQLFILL